MMARSAVLEEAFECSAAVEDLGCDENSDDDDGAPPPPPEALVATARVQQGQTAATYTIERIATVQRYHAVVWGRSSDAMIMRREEAIGVR